MTLDSSQATSSKPEKLDPALVRLAMIVLLGAVVVQLDTTIVTVAIDTFSREFSAPLSTVQWVTTAYLLAMAVVMPVSGWATDRFGAKASWLFALMMFLLGSTLCGLAWSLESLIAFRALQGLGGGLILPLMQGIIAQAAGPARMRQLMGVIAIPTAVVPVLGPVLGGVIVDDLDWRWVFLVNVPVCLAGLYAAWRGMPQLGAPGKRRLDVLGLSLLSPGLAFCVFGLSEAGRKGGFGDAEVVWPLVVGTVLLAGFVGHALSTRHEPIIDLRLFRSGAFTGSAMLLLLFGFSLFGGLFLVPLFDQRVRGLSPIEAGLMLAPQGAGMSLALIGVARLGAGVSPRVVTMAGLVLTTAGTLVYTQADAGTNAILLAASMAVRGVGIGAAFVTVMTTAYHGLAPAAIPRATSTTRILQQIGASFGTAVLAVVLTQGSRGVTDVDGLAAAFGNAFWWTLWFTALAAPLVALLPAAQPSSEQSAGEAPTGAADHPTDATVA